MCHASFSSAIISQTIRPRSLRSPAPAPAAGEIIGGQRKVAPPLAALADAVTSALAIDRGAVSSQSDRDHPDRLAGLPQVENLPPFIEGEVTLGRDRPDGQLI